MNDSERQERHALLIEGLMEFSEVFYTFGKFGRPVFTTDMRNQTACISLTRDGDELAYCWDRDFFDSCSDYLVKFIICHEMLHVLLKHGKRAFDLDDRDKVNVCLDLVVNHLLINQFGFNRCLIDGWEKYCWIDTVFKTNIKEMFSFENYYSLNDSLFKKAFILDNHSFFDERKGDDEQYNTEHKVDEKIEELRKKLYFELPSCGDDSYGKEEVLEIKKIKRRKFNDLVKKILASIIEKDKKNSSTWAKINRVLVNSAPDIPVNDRLIERRCNQKYKCAFFIDNSGSCLGYSQRFFDVLNSLDEEKFEVSAFSFDTNAFPLDVKNGRILGGGGTSFSCIDKKVLEINPDVVFVLTDGYAPKFIPKDPKKYFWFLTECGSSVSIAGAGRVERLSQFE